MTKFEAAVEILRRTKDFEFPLLTDGEFVTNTEAIFLELGHREMYERPESRRGLAHSISPHRPVHTYNLKHETQSYSSRS